MNDKIEMPKSFLDNIGRIQLTMAAISSAIYQFEHSQNIDPKVSDELTSKLYCLWNYSDAKSAAQNVSSDLKEIYNRIYHQERGTE